MLLLLSVFTQPGPVEVRAYRQGDDTGTSSTGGRGTLGHVTRVNDDGG